VFTFLKEAGREKGGGTETSSERSREKEACAFCYGKRSGVRGSKEVGEGGERKDKDFEALYR